MKPPPPRSVDMSPADLSTLLETVKQELSARPETDALGILGVGPAAYDIESWLNAAGLGARLTGVYDTPGQEAGLRCRPMEALERDCPDVLIVASDKRKEALIEAALPHIKASARLLIGGFDHFRYRDLTFEQETANALVPSFANGYPNCLIHLWQILQNAARLGLDGTIVEFGMFRGGTTMLLSRFAERLGKDWPVIGFDTFDGFPSPRSPLDMYSHPDCVFLDEIAARRYLAGRNVEIVPGDIVETASRLKDRDILLAFIDTDNYTSAMAALNAVQDQIVPRGAIVFDHFTGVDRFLYTLGERMAAKRLLGDSRFFNLHGTGVFLRQSA
jgi:hypothetical protein